MPHDPFRHRRRAKSDRQDSGNALPNELSRLFGLDTSTDAGQSTPTATVDSPIAVTVSATSAAAATPVSSCTYLRLLRIDLNSLPSSPLHCIVYPDVLIDPYYDHPYHPQYLICYLDADYYSTSEPYLGFFISRLIHIPSAFALACFHPNLLSHGIQSASQWDLFGPPQFH